MSTTKPKALRLAEILEGDYCPDSFYKRGIDKVSAEIRAQHARIAEIGAQLEAIGAGMNTQQPPALWLANEMLQAAAFPAYPPLPNAAVAQELRRQHARIAELEAQIEAIGAAGSSEGSHMTNTNTASGAAIQRYKIGYYSDGWGERSSTPSGIPDASGAWVRYEDHVAALASTPGAARSSEASTTAASEVDDQLMSGDSQASKGREIDENYAQKLALELECMLFDPNKWLDSAAKTLDEYKTAWNEINPGHPTLMGEPVTPDRDAICAAIRAQREAVVIAGVMEHTATASAQGPRGGVASVAPWIGVGGQLSDEREAFETWFKKARLIYTTERRENGSYFSSHANMMWEAWLARASNGQPALGSAQNDAIRRSPPTRDEMLDCAVAAYRLSPYSKDNLRRCFQSSTQHIESSCNWTANELMAFALGIAALYAPQFSEKRDATDD